MYKTFVIGLLALTTLVWQVTPQTVSTTTVSTTTVSTTAGAGGAPATNAPGPTVTPFACTYRNGIYYCDWRFAMPLYGGGFNPGPQRLEIFNVDGAINDANILEFNLVNTSLFDSNYDASLGITCLQGGGTLVLDMTSFKHMGFYKSVHIYNCEFDAITPGAFISLGSLNYFGISGGSIQNAQPHALAGMMIEKDQTSVDPKGEMSITNVVFQGGEFQNDFIEDQNDISILTLEGVNIITVEDNLLDNKEKMTTLNLGNNNYTTIPKRLFSGLKALSTLNMAGISWACSCSNLWWMTYATDHGIRITSETICATPSSYQGRRAASFHDGVCTSGLQCDGGSLPAMNLADVTCLTYLQLFIYILAIVAFIGLIVLAYFWLRTRRQVGRNGGGGSGPGGRRSSRVHNNGRQNPPNIKGGWS